MRSTSSWSVVTRSMATPARSGPRSPSSPACPSPPASGSWASTERILSLTLEHDDGTGRSRGLASRPCSSVAERLCEPCKVPPPQRAEVPADRITVTTAAALGEGPWGQAGSPTSGRPDARDAPRPHARRSSAARPAEQAAEAVALLVRAGCVDGGGARRQVPIRRRRGCPSPASGRMIAVLTEPDRPQVGAELLASRRA